MAQKVTNNMELSTKWAKIYSKPSSSKKQSKSGHQRNVHVAFVKFVLAMSVLI